MNSSLPIETYTKEAANPPGQASGASRSEKSEGFDLMLCQLMQAIMSVPAQPQISAAESSLPAGPGTAAGLPTDGTADKAALISQDAITGIQSAFIATINDLLKGALSSQGDAVAGNDQAAQAGITPSLLKGIRSIVAAAGEELPDGVAENADVLTGSAGSQDQTSVKGALSAFISDRKDAATDEGITPALIGKPDSRGSVAFSLPDTIQKTSALEEHQPGVIREIILAEGGSSKDMADLTDTLEHAEKDLLQETLPAASSGPHGPVRMHAQVSEGAATAVRPQHFSEAMHMEGNRLMVTRLDGTSIGISLQPEGLGKLDIGLLLDKGVVNAQIVASNAEGKSLIEKHMNDIVTALAQEGITIGGFSVSLRDDRADLFWDQGKDQEQQIQGESAMTSEYISAPRQLIDRGAVSIFV